MRAAPILTKLRDGGALSREEIAWVAQGLASGDITDAQAGAFAMAACIHGLGDAGRVALTEAMRDSGALLSWDLPGPVVDKHSTGGVGDCVSLLLAPILAEAGAFVPMISGRGLGHTGGTLDKLEAIPGFEVDQDEAGFRRIVAEVGCAIVSASADLAPADKRLYAVRDVTGTVESIDLITASILSKKLAAGLEALVLDVKCGSGAFMETEDDALELAQSLVATANGAGCRTKALVTDMTQPLAPAAGNALEVQAVIAALSGEGTGRLVDVSVALCGEALSLAGLAEDAAAGEALSRTILADGRARERFGRMVTAQGGPSDVAGALPLDAPVVRDVAVPESGYVARIDGRALGDVVVDLGGGRRRESDRIDPRVGLSHLCAVGASVDRGDPLARVHAADEDAAVAAIDAVASAITISEDATAPPPLIIGRVAP